MSKELFKQKYSKFKPKEKIKINNLSDLHRFVESIKPSDGKKESAIIVDTKKNGMADDSYNGMVSIPQPSNQSMMRSALLDGLEMVKNHRDYYETYMEDSSTADYGGFKPATIPDPKNHKTWIDVFIKENLGAVRDGLKIVWDLPEGKFELDPWTCSLEKTNDS